MGIAFACLHSSMAEKELLGGEDKAVAVEGVTGDEEVGNAGFVLKGEKAVPPGRAGSLPADDESGASDVLAMGDGTKVDGAER